MSKDVNLKAMRCPTCGGSLRVADDTKTIVCVYCENRIVPVSDTSGVPQNTARELNGTLRVEGIKTSSSALAYIEIFFEEYDWEAFSYVQSLSIKELEKLTASLKVTSADDKNTWVVCFKTVSVPFLKKMEGCKQLLADVIKEYKTNSLDAYSKFDAYKRVLSQLLASKGEVQEKLEKSLFNAAKYGASAAELEGLKRELEEVKSANVPLYGELDEIPEVQAYTEEKNNETVAQLARRGINAQAEYERALALIESQKYVEALSVLRTLSGYRDADALAKKIDQYYLIADVLEVEGKLYYYKRMGEGDVWSLYPTANGKIAASSLIQGIRKIVTNYADVLYYLDSEWQLRRFSLSENAGQKLANLKISEKSIYVYGKKAFMLSVQSDSYEEGKKDVIELDLAAGVVKVLAANVKGILSFEKNKLVYETSVTVSEKEGQARTAVRVCVLNVDTAESVQLDGEKVHVEGFIHNSVVYTCQAPNDYNMDLYVMPFGGTRSAMLLEANIYKFCGMMAGKLFYFVGNSQKEALINITPDGLHRTEWPLYVSQLLFERGGWVYFIRKIGYNSILGKARVDGSRSTIIASDIESFVEIKNGYLYYVNNESTLVKIRMDGSNSQELCYAVEKVLAVREDKIIFISADDGVVVRDGETTSVKGVKSIYAVDFTGSGTIKLAYNVKTAKTYDENAVYYIATKRVKLDEEGERDLNVLYRLDVETNVSEKLLDLEFEKEEESGGFAAAMILMVIGFLVGIIGFAAEASAVGVLGLLAGFISMFVGIAKKANQTE